MPHQTSSASSRIDNRDSFNIQSNHIDNAYNDYSETHCKYASMQHARSLFEIRVDYGRVPPANERVRPQCKSIRKGDIIPNIDD